jgi:catechol 2,3-dioxygenase-like lactoylglutathione lyase family enzyme
MAIKIPFCHGFHTRRVFGPSPVTFLADRRTSLNFRQGRAFWHGRTGLFLSIDHSAITVSPTEKSLAFYQGLLGLHTAYAGTNEGETQERLDGAAGAVVRITGLQAAAPQGPGIEFLQYEKPTTGRPAAGIRADDAAHAHLTLVVDSVQEILAAPERSVFPRAPYT